MSKMNKTVIDEDDKSKSDISHIRKYESVNDQIDSLIKFDLHHKSDMQHSNKQGTEDALSLAPSCAQVLEKSVPQSPAKMMIIEDRESEAKSNSEVEIFTCHDIDSAVSKSIVVQESQEVVLGDLENHNI